MAMSFLQAFKAKESGAISWEEYIRCLFARCRGIQHEEDSSSSGKPWKDLRETDPFGYSIWLHSEVYATVNDTSRHEALFKAYRRGTLEDIRKVSASLHGPLAKPAMKSLMFLALRERRADVLKFCFDEGIVVCCDSVFYDEVERVDQKSDPETFKVIEQSEYRTYNRKRPTESDEFRYRAAAIFDKGGKLPVYW